MNATELVWDRDDSATATSGAYLLAAGPASDWPPPLLLATAASASLLTTFIELAREADMDILGYVAQQRPEVDANTSEVRGITISACISVASDGAAAQARVVWAVAVRHAPVLRVLNCRVTCESSIVVLSDALVEA